MGYATQHAAQPQLVGPPGWKASREGSFRHPLLAGAGSGCGPSLLAGGGGLVIPGPESEREPGSFGQRVWSGRRRLAGSGGPVSPEVGGKGARGLFGRGAQFPGLGRERGRGLFGQRALWEGRAGGEAGRPEVHRSLRREAQRWAGAGGVVGGGAGAGDGQVVGTWAHRLMSQAAGTPQAGRGWKGARRPHRVPAGIQRWKAERSSVLCGAGRLAGGWWGSGPVCLRRFWRRELAAQPAL